MSDSAPTHRPPANVRVLLVDDNADSRDMYRFYLDQVGFRVELAADGVEGLTKAQACYPDIIVLDLSLPALDGWTVCRILKGGANTGGIPVIALSGFTDENSRALAQAAGVDAFLSKPCLPEQLVDEIRRQLDRTRAS